VAESGTDEPGQPATLSGRCATRCLFTGQVIICIGVKEQLPEQRVH